MSKFLTLVLAVTGLVSCVLVPFASARSDSQNAVSSKYAKLKVMNYALSRGISISPISVYVVTNIGHCRPLYVGGVQGIKAMKRDSHFHRGSQDCGSEFILQTSNLRYVGFRIRSHMETSDQFRIKGWSMPEIGKYNGYLGLFHWFD